MMGTFEFEEEDVGEGLVGVDVEDAAGWRTDVMIIVDTPALPDDT